MLIVSPEENTVVGTDRGIVRSFALLKPELPPRTPRSVPELTGLPFLLTISWRSKRVPTSSLFFRPIQTRAAVEVELVWSTASKSEKPVPLPLTPASALWSPIAKTWSVMSCV
jgi:hypothetical protein